MALWFNLAVNAERIGHVEIQRREYFDLTDQAAIADAVGTYDVYRDGWPVGQVRHRYGDGAWRLLALVAGLLADDASPDAPSARLSSPQSAQTAPARGSGCTDTTETLLDAAAVIGGALAARDDDRHLDRKEQP